MRLLVLIPALLMVACGPQPKQPVEPAPAWTTPQGRDQVRLEVAEALIESGRVRDGQQVLAQMAADGVRSGELTLLQARALWLDGLHAEAERVARDALRQLPRDPRPLRLLGVILADEGKVPEAITTLRRATSLDGRDAATWNNLGFLLLAEQDYAEARKALERAVSLDGANPRYRTNLGFALAASDRPREALQAFRSVGPPEDAHANLALAYELRGDTPKAREQYLQALELNPQHAPSREGLARVSSDGPETP